MFTSKPVFKAGREDSQNRSPCSTTPDIAAQPSEGDTTCVCRRKPCNPFQSCRNVCGAGPEGLCVPIIWCMVFITRISYCSWACQDTCQQAKPPYSRSACIGPIPMPHRWYTSGRHGASRAGTWTGCWKLWPVIAPRQLASCGSKLKRWMTWRSATTSLLCRTF